MSAHFYRAPDRLQAVLLAKPKAVKRSPDFWPGVALTMCGLAVAVMAVAGWLPGAGA